MPAWSPLLHGLFPRPLRLAIRELLLVSRCRGFGLRGPGPAAGAAEQAGVGGGVAEGAAQQPRGQQQEGAVWLDLNVVLLIAKLLAGVWST